MSLSWYLLPGADSFGGCGPTQEAPPPSRPTFSAVPTLAWRGPRSSGVAHLGVPLSSGVLGAWQASCPMALPGDLCLGEGRPPGPDSPAACLPQPQVPAALSAPVCPRHEQLQAQRANVEAQELALLAERERLVQDGHRQRGLEEELRRLQSEHDRY